MILRLAASQRLRPTRNTEILRRFASERSQTIQPENRGVKAYIDCYSYMILILYLEPLRPIGLDRVMMSVKLFWRG